MSRRQVCGGSNHASTTEGNGQLICCWLFVNHWFIRKERVLSQRFYGQLGSGVPYSQLCYTHLNCNWSFLLFCHCHHYYHPLCLLSMRLLIWEWLQFFRFGLEYFEWFILLLVFMFVSKCAGQDVKVVQVRLLCVPHEDQHQGQGVHLHW